MRDEHGEHLLDGLDRLRGADLGHPRGVVRVAEQSRPLGPQRGDPSDDVACVVLVASRAARDRRPEQPFAQPAVCEGGQRGLVGGQHEREHVAAGVTTGLGGACGCRDRVRRQSVEPRGVVDDDRRSVRVGE
jgi:hypothetical protein